VLTSVSFTSKQVSLHMDKFKPGDYYEDCSFHPCLCTEVDEHGGISGISLIDGSSPRNCDINYCGVRRLTLDEVLLWKKAGPQNLEHPWIPLPDKQWWWPRQIEGINPAGTLQFLFDSSLNYLRGFARSHLGDEIIAWYDTAGSFNDKGPGSRAQATYRVHGSIAQGTVLVEAVKEGRLWPIQKIQLTLDGQEKSIVYEGEQVRGCGFAG
jgi:hypothetical protein